MSIRTTFKGQLWVHITQLKPSVVLHQACKVKRRLCWYLWSRWKPHSQRMLQFSAKLTLMLQLLLPHSHISGLRHHKFDLFLAFIPPPPPLDEGEEKISISSHGTKFFYAPLPFFTIFSAMVSSSTSCISSESQPPSTQPTFHPLVLKSWILSGLDLTYSFLFPCTSITFLKSRKGPGVTMILGRRDEASVLLRLQVLSYRCKPPVPLLGREYFGWQGS